MNMKINLFVFSTTLIVFLLISIISCNLDDSNEIIKNRKIEGLETVVYDSCEYVFDIFTDNIEHKGNCRFCEERKHNNE